MITSNVSSLPEVAGEAGVIVNPSSVTQICEALRLVLDDQELRRRLVESGRSRLQQYSWDHSASLLAEVLLQRGREAL